MGLVKTRRLAAMHKQTTYAKATVVRQRAKAGMRPPLKKDGGTILGLKGRSGKGSGCK